MTQLVINVGTAPNDGLGDPIRTAFIKTNDNFDVLFSIPQGNIPPTLTGSPGDIPGMYAYDPSYFYYCFATYTGNSVIWGQLAPIGNISATQILNGTSSIQILNSGGNANVSIGGSSNIVVFTNTGVNVTGRISASGNVQSANLFTAGRVSATGNVIGSYIFGNGSQLTGLPALYGNANVADYMPTYLPTYTGNIGADNITNSGNIATQGIVSAAGNIVTAGYFVGNFLGNITGNIVVPGSNTQVLFNTSGNVDAVAGMTFSKGPNTFVVLGTISSQGNVLAGNVVTVGKVTATGNITGGNIVTLGNVSGNYFLGDGSLLTGIAGTYSNANVASYMPTYSGDLGNVGNITAAGNLSVTGNAAFANVSVTGITTDVGNITGGNFISTGLASISLTITGGNIDSNGYVNADGNITGNAIYSTTIISAVGNIYGDNIIGTISGNVANAVYADSAGTATTANAVTGNAQANITSVGTLTSLSATGNIRGGNILTPGFVSAAGNVYTTNLFVTNIASITGNIKTSGLISASGNITAFDFFTIGEISAGGNVSANNVRALANVTTSTLNVGNIVNSNANGVGNIGTSTTYFNTIFAKATSAQYADLAEVYVGDQTYAPGTVVSFGGNAEVTQSKQDLDVTVAGVISTNPAYIMNTSEVSVNMVIVALTGRVPCRVTGPVTQGAMMVSAGDGSARAEKNPVMGSVIGKALESFDGTTGTIEIVVGRL